MNTFKIIALKFGLNSKGFIKKFVAYTRYRGEAPPKKSFSVPFTFLIFLMICDIHTTLQALQLPGAYEGNIFMSSVVNNPLYLIAVKVVFILWLPLFYRLSRGYEHIVLLGLYTIIIMYLGVVLNNVLIIIL